MSVFEGYPSDVGMSLSRYKSYRMEMHYDNPDYRADLRDNSGGQFMVDMQLVSLKKHRLKHRGVTYVL